MALSGQFFFAFVTAKPMMPTDHKDNYVPHRTEKIWDQVDEAPRHRTQSQALRLALAGLVAVLVVVLVLCTANRPAAETQTNALDNHIENPRASRKAVLVGGFGESHSVTPEVTQLVGKMKERILARAQAAGLNSDGSMFEPISYRSQVVAGTNYYVKIRISKTDYIHVKIFKPLPYSHDEPLILSIDIGKKEHDVLG